MTIEFIHSLLYNTPMSFMSLARKLAGLLCVLALPLALTLTGVRWIALDPGFYTHGFAKYRVADATGMSPDELTIAAHQLIDYFSTGRPITLQIHKAGQLAPLFDEREQAHLIDVRALIQLTFLVQEIAVAYIVLYVTAAIAVKRREFLATIAPNVLAGSLLTLVILLGLGLAAMSDFSDLWVRFHLVSFSNDFWLLDPRTDYMIRMFPEGFWFDAVLQLAVMSAGAAVTLAIASFAYLRRRSPFYTRP